MKTFLCVCLCASGSKVDGFVMFCFVFPIGCERNTHIIYEIFLLYGIFHGMLKWNHNNVVCKEPLEPSSQLSAFSMAIASISICGSGQLGLTRQSLHGWRIHSYAVIRYQLLWC